VKFGKPTPTTRTNRVRRLLQTILFSWLASASFASAIKIQIDYTYDTNNYFGPAERKAALEAAASFFEKILSDTLLGIDPAEYPGSSWTVSVKNPETGISESLPNFVVPEDTIIVFAGARDLGGSVRGQGGSSGWSGSGSSSWLSRIRGRGNPGADFSSENSALVTDYAPAVGFVSFDVTTSFNYSTTQDLSGTDFVSVALHELAHVLGIGIATSWNNLISGRSFTGSASTRAAGSNPAVDNAGGHFAQSVSDHPAFGSFERPHGSTTPVLMRPSITTGGGLLTVATDLDLAALADIGWEVTPPFRPAFPSLGPGAVTITWPSSSFRSYVIEKSTNLDFATGTQIPLNGNGSVLLWNDPAPAANRSFYRLRDLAYTPVADASSLGMASTVTAPPNNEIVTEFIAPRWVEGCECGGH
jgi:hypothetical protein